MEQSRLRAEAIAGRLVTERHDRPSLVSRIAREIAAEIIEGIRQPGNDLNSVELARHYRTSRTPIREALMLLEKEGMVDIPPRRRPRVAGLTIKEIRDIYRVRANLLELIAQDIARSASAAEIDALLAMIRAMRSAVKAADVRAFFWANVDFHELNTELGGNRIVKKIIDSLLLRTLPPATHWPVTAGAHAEIVRRARTSLPSLCGSRCQSCGGAHPHQPHQRPCRAGSIVCTAPAGGVASVGGWRIRCEDGGRRACAAASGISALTEFCRHLRQPEAASGRISFRGSSEPAGAAGTPFERRAAVP